MIGLEFIRKQYDMSLADLSEKLGISRQFISKWEKGEKKIPDKYLPLLSDIFGLYEDVFTSELTDIEKLEIQSQKYLRSVKGEIEIESMEEGKRDKEIFVIPKNFDTDPRFSRIYQNYLKTGFLQNLEDLKGMYEMLEEMSYDTDQDRNTILKNFGEIVDAFVNAIHAKDIEYNELLDFLEKYQDK